MTAVGIIVLISSLFAGIMTPWGPKPDPSIVNSLKNVNWDQRHHIDFYGVLLNNLSIAYPKLCKTYSIGHTWRERPLWCIEISDGDSRHKKVEVAVLGNIHGGEQESGESAAYVAWWLVMNSGTNKTAKKILEDYIVYVVPVINPDGYENSFLQGTRSNFRPVDHNGDTYPANDPYCDTNGDGIISTVYTAVSGSNVSLGLEGKDFDNNKILSDDAKPSGIDLNRNFDYMWARYDPDATPQMGARLSFSSAGPDAASEPEVRAVQDFLASKHIKSLATLHTGEQSVLFPWCYTAEHPADFAFMNKTACEMAAAYSATTGPTHGGYYYMQSYADYPTAAELIDWSYGRLGIYSYTIEVIASGTGQYRWTTLPAAPYVWTYIGTWQPRPPSGNTWTQVWFRTRPIVPTVPPGEQHLVCQGLLAAVLVMFNSVAPH